MGCNLRLDANVLWVIDNTGKHFLSLCEEVMISSTDEIQVCDQRQIHMQWRLVIGVYKEMVCRGFTWHVNLPVVAQGFFELKDDDVWKKTEILLNWKQATVTGM